MGIATFLADIWLFVSLGIAVFWGIATYAFATWANLRYPWMWSLIGAVAPVLGLIVAVIMHFNQRSSGHQPSHTIAPVSEDLW